MLPRVLPVWMVISPAGIRQERHSVTEFRLTNQKVPELVLVEARTSVRDAARKIALLRV
jgi:hypothetical protein